MIPRPSLSFGPIQSFRFKSNTLSGWLVRLRSSIFNQSDRHVHLDAEREHYCDEKSRRAMLDRHSIEPKRENLKRGCTIQNKCRLPAFNIHLSKSQTTAPIIIRSPSLNRTITRTHVSLSLSPRTNRLAGYDDCVTRLLPNSWNPCPLLKGTRQRPGGVNECQSCQDGNHSSISVVIFLIKMIIHIRVYVV